MRLRAGRGLTAGARIRAGGEEVFAVRLMYGRRVEASADTGFVTLDGWTPLRALAIGDRVGLPRRVRQPLSPQRMVDGEVILLAHMIGDGSCVKNQPIRYASVDEVNLRAALRETEDGMEATFR